MKPSRDLALLSALGLSLLALAACAPTPSASSLRESGDYAGYAPLPTGSEIYIHSRYVIDLPPGYDPASESKYHLQVFLHGAGETGVPFEEFEQRMARPAVLAQNASDYPVIILFPQLPHGSLTWKQMAAALDELVGQVVQKYPVDAQRVYLTGYSDGGFGALALGAKYPERFAAVASIAGYYDFDVDELCGLKDTPTLIYHGALDQVIPLQAEKEVEAALAECGASKLTVTVFEDRDHFTILDETLDSASFYKSLFSITLGD